ncbi:MAG: hypothetical protein ACRBK7_27335 [Acidimicrobiales bacterium]
MISQTNQRLAMTAMVAVAFLAIVLGAIYQDDNKLDEPRVIGGNTSAPAAGGGAAPAADVAVTAGPIEGFLPKSGEASACSETIGVDLTSGYGAKLTINGIEIAPEQMNVNLDETGAISNVITASRSLGQYTFEPDDACPNGSLLRPVDNRLDVCVYRLSDSTERCVVRREHIFDAL